MVAEFLGELINTPFSEEGSAPLRAARQNAQLMGDQMQRAGVDFLRAELLGEAMRSTEHGVAP